MCEGKGVGGPRTDLGSGNAFVGYQLRGIPGTGIGRDRGCRVRRSPSMEA